MALETGTYIDDLVATNPAATDALSAADDHIRLIKSTIKATFPNITGPVTGTQLELNLIDGVTATTAELNILDGVTSTAAELNILDGVTSTAAELNILDGVTSTAAELNILDGVTATTAELNYVDGVTSNLQTQLDAKVSPPAQAASVWATGTSTVESTITAAKLRTEVTGGAKSLASNGYQVFPGGLIMQWGSATCGRDTSTTVSLPYTFPNACLQATATYGAQANTSSTDDAMVSIHTLTTTTVKIGIGAIQESSLLCRFIAIGH
jgi:hypothetical protein